jgi:hypothetical protein
VIPPTAEALAAVGSKRKRAPEYRFVADQETGQTKTVKVSQRGEGTIMEIVKPLIHDSSDKKDRELAHLFEFVDVLRKRERTLKTRVGRADAAGGGEPAGEDGAELTPTAARPTRAELKILGMNETLPAPTVRRVYLGGYAMRGRAPYTLAPELVEELNRDWAVEIRHDVRDVDGNLYVPGGANSGTMCGAFPHGIRKLGSGAFSGKPSYQVACNRDIALQIRLVKKNLTGSDPRQWNEQVVLSKIRSVVPEEEQRLWGSHESQFSYHVHVRFEDGEAIVANREAATSERPFSFKADVATGRLLTPAEGQPGAGGFYDFTINNGKGTREGFHFNNGATHVRLVSEKQQAKWVIEAFPLNPYLAQIESLYAVSVPFCVKSSLAPGIGGHERYVYDGEGAPPRQIPTSKAGVKAQMPRRAAQ